MVARDIIVVGASAGGVEALIELVRGLPSDLAASSFVVLHLPPDYPSFLPEILSRVGGPPATRARDGEPIVPGRVYVAPPDHHLLVKHGRTRLVRGPRESRHRPALDPLFRSAAIAYGPRVVGVVLSGMGSDGTAGLHAIKRRGGVAVVQDPEDALFRGMPESALTYVDVDYRLPVREISGLLNELSRSPAPDESAFPVPEDLLLEHDQMTQKSDAPDMDRYGEISEFTCPECDGPMWERHDGGLLRYRCRTGHAFTAEGVIEARSEELEQNLWSALNKLEESALLSERIAEDARARGYERTAARFEQKAESDRQRALLLRRMLQEERPDTAR